MTKRELARQLERHSGCDVRLTLTDNYRSMISVRHRDGVAEVRMHRMFLDAPDDVLNAVGYYIGGDESGMDCVREYIRENEHRINYQPRRTYLRPRGRHFDLEELRDEVLGEHFPDDDWPHISWGRTTPGKNKSSIQFASYDGRKDLIRINPKLDASFVPGYFVRFLIFHEMLHREIPPTPGNVHSVEFTEQLEKFPEYQRAMEWEENNLHRFVKAAEKKR
ncbi:MAG: hypothetical protein ACLFWL_08355 [Candidatus Brocadiia bacterium]